MDNVAPSQYSYSWFIKQFDHAKKQSNILFSSVRGDNFLTRKPAPDRWSAAECLDHLIVFGNIYYENINRGIETATPDAASSNDIFKPRWIWRGIIRFFEPPYKLKMKTISSFQPAEQAKLNVTEVMGEFRDLQNRFIDQIERCRQKGIHLKKEKVSNPALPFVKMTLSESYAIAEAHQRRHLWQAEQVLQKLREEQL